MNRSDSDKSELPIFRPEMGRTVRVDQVPKLKPGVLVKRSKSNGKATGRKFSTRGGHPNRGRKAAATRTPAQSARRVVVKGRVVLMNAYGKKAAKLHLSYIKRDGVEQDGSEGELYGRDESFSEDNFAKDIK